MGMRLFDFLINFLTSGFFSFFLDFLGLDALIELMWKLKFF